VEQQKRVANLRRRLSGQRLDGLLVTGRENIRYLSGFTGSSGMLLVTHEQAVLLTDFRYAIQAGQETVGVEVRLGENPLKLSAQLLKEAKLHRLGFEAEDLNYDRFDKLKDICRQQEIELVPSHQLVAELRLIKEAAEIAQIKQAVAIAEAAFRQVIKQLKPGIREKDLALELEFAIRRSGSAKLPFEIIVASGERSAMPHGVASDKVIPAGELIIIDFGASHNGYTADISRTLLLGEPNPKQWELYQLVYEAQAEAIANVRPGMRASELDEVARGVIERTGYGEYFGHGTGHGVGLQVHEEPRISRENDDLLSPGAVFTIEPGIYLPDTGGVRIEDMVLVTENGCEVLTSLPKDLDFN
jgi:Xaa-Pro aminopeptidase